MRTRYKLDRRQRGRRKQVRRHSGRDRVKMMREPTACVSKQTCLCAHSTLYCDMYFLGLCICARQRMQRVCTFHQQACAPQLATVPCIATHATQAERITDPLQRCITRSYRLSCQYIIWGGIYYRPRDQYVRLYTQNHDHGAAPWLYTRNHDHGAAPREAANITKHPYTDTNKTTARPRAPRAREARVMGAYGTQIYREVVLTGVARRRGASRTH